MLAKVPLVSHCSMSTLRRTSNVCIKHCYRFLSRNRWSSVCSDFWNVNAANVVCHELGFDKADTLRTPAYFSPFRPAPSTWFSNFYCNGDENSLSQCIYTISNTETCSGRDVGVVCGMNCTARMKNIICKCKN